ncbi:hypothetical protein D3C80_1411570 [compost metagenome]
MAEHHRTPGTDIIDIGFAIDIVQKRAICTFNKQRRSTDAGKGANGRVYAARDKLTCSAVQVFRLAHSVFLVRRKRVSQLF